jgi:hypothetical protein
VYFLNMICIFSNIFIAWPKDRDIA